MRTVPHRLRTIFLPDVPLHVIAVQGPAGVRPDIFLRNIGITAQEVDALAFVVRGPEVDGAIVVVLGLLAGVAAGAVVGEELLAFRYRALAVLFIQLRYQCIAVFEFARCPQFGGTLRKKEVRNVRQTVFNGAEVRAIAPALPNVERRLSKSAIVRVKHKEVRQVIFPARL